MVTEKEKKKNTFNSIIHLMEIEFEIEIPFSFPNWPNIRCNRLEWDKNANETKTIILQSIKIAFNRIDYTDPILLYMLRTCVCLSTSTRN